MAFHVLICWYHWQQLSVVRLAVCATFDGDNCSVNNPCNSVMCSCRRQWVGLRNVTGLKTRWVTCGVWLTEQLLRRRGLRSRSKDDFSTKLLTFLNCSILILSWMHFVSRLQGEQYWWTALCRMDLNRAVVLCWNYVDIILTLVYLLAPFKYCIACIFVVFSESNAPENCRICIQDLPCYFKIIIMKMLYVLQLSLVWKDNSTTTMHIYVSVITAKILTKHQSTGPFAYFWLLRMMNFHCQCYTVMTTHMWSQFQFISELSGFEWTVWTVVVQGDEVFDGQSKVCLQLVWFYQRSSHQRQDW